MDGKSLTGQNPLGLASKGKNVNITVVNLLPLIYSMLCGEFLRCKTGLCTSLAEENCGEKSLRKNLFGSFELNLRNR